MRLFKVLLVLAVLALGGLAGYAYFGDMDANQTEMRKPVALDLGQPESGAPPAAPTGDAAAPAAATETPPAAEAQTGGAAPAQASDPNGID